MKLKKLLLAATLSAGLGLMIAPSLPASAQSTGTVNPDVQSGIDSSIATVKALSPLALACLSVALVPLGSMLTLRFLNMVLSRV